MIKALKYGIRQGLKHWRAGLIVYSILLSLALTIGIQVYHVLEASIGRSLELEKLVKQYDHTVIQDFIKVHGASISPLFGQLRWYLGLYLIFSIFINGGLFNCVLQKEAKRDWINFWTGGAKYFWPFLKQGLFFLIMFVFWTAIIAVPTSMYVSSIFNTTATELPMYWAAGIATLLVLCYWIILVSWSINTKLVYLRDEVKIWPSIKKGFRLTVRKYLSSSRLLLLFIVFQLVIVVAHLYVEGIFGMTSTALIILFFITQQLLVFFRILWRIMIYNGFDLFNFKDAELEAQMIST